jgi:hypothetical protein
MRTHFSHNQRFHCFRALTKVVSENQDDWDLQLDAVLFGIRTKKHASTGFSPFRLLYHREARLPSQMDDAMEEVSYLSV